ncbi:uncharacterized protein LOC132744387 [Ruditapes philippinarum]|uniref:uncharacterized protein LOC132744387 n=1 Tax=Ruditapes philippinarum TaxID=129788 RepID=UPI00295ACB6E|nr:uncharacterized protein LOC132744387 [Ruditapes philippinarum]
MFSHHLVYFTWLLVSCLLICILNVLNLFDNFINSDNQSKSGKTCYYIYVLYSTLVSFVGICLVSLAIDVTWLTASTTQHLVEIARKKMRIHIICFILLIVCFFINNVPHLSQHVSFRSLNKCWKGNAYEGHANIAAVIDLVQHGVIIFTTSVTLLLAMFVIRYKTRQKELMVIPEYMRVMDNDADTNIGDIEQTEEGLQASVSVETPSSELIAKSDEQAMGYKRFEPQANENGKQRLLYRQNGSLKRSSRWKAEKDSSSKDSSCHENSGYISEEQDGHEQRRLNLGFNSTRRRIKSDSEIQEPRSQTYVAVRKSRKQKSHKMMEDQVFEALENFFMTDPSKLLFKALASQKQCELSAHLIDDSNEDKEVEEETSFNDKKLKKLEIRKKNIKLPLRKSKSLKGPSSHTDRKSRTNWSSLSYKGRSSINGGQSIECLDFSQCPETFTLREKGMESTKGTEIDVSKTAAVQKDSIGVEKKKIEVFNSPKIIVEDVDKEPTALVSEPNKIARENSDPHLSVNVDVHCSDFNVSISSMDTIVTDIECHIKEHSRSKSVDMPKTQQARDIAGGIEDNARSKSIDVPKTPLNGINWVEFMPDDNVKMAKLKDEEVRESNSLFVNVETQTDKNDAVGTDKLETDAVFSDIGKNNQAVLSDIKKNDQAGVDMSVNLKSDRDGMETEIGTKSEIAVEVANTSEIETENSVEKRKEEMVQFKDYCKRYLLQPYKNITGFLVVYAVCLLPQILLDIYRIVAGNQETVLDRTDGIIAICSDAAQPVFLLAITVLFLWQCRERRNIKEEGISQQ